MIVGTRPNLAYRDHDKRRQGIAEATGLLDLSEWPAGSRVILRKERPHPGAQLTFTDVDGHRITAFITDTPPRVVPGQLAGLDLRHRQHARVEDRIRQAKATGMRNFPCNGFAANSAWLEIVMTAMDLVAWSKLVGFADEPELARCEIATFRYRCCTSPPGSATAPGRPDSASTRPGGGPNPSPEPGSRSAPRSPEPRSTPCPSDPKPNPRRWNRR